MFFLFSSPGVIVVALLQSSPNFSISFLFKDTRLGCPEIVLLCPGVIPLYALTAYSHQKVWGMKGHIQQHRELPCSWMIPATGIPETFSGSLLSGRQLLILPSRLTQFIPSCMTLNLSLLKCLWLEHTKRWLCKVMSDPSHYIWLHWILFHLKTLISHLSK